MQLLCGQCGQLITLKDGDDAVSTTCEKCGHVIPIPGRSTTPAGSDHYLDSPYQEGFAVQALSAMPHKIRVTCSDCGKHFNVGARRAGMRGECPICKAKIDIPYPGEEDKLPAERSNGSPGKQPNKNEDEPAPLITALPRAKESSPEPDAQQEEAIIDDPNDLPTRMPSAGDSDTPAKRSATAMLVLILAGAVALAAVAIVFIPKLFTPPVVHSTSLSDEEPDDESVNTATAPVAETQPAPLNDHTSGNDQTTPPVKTQKASLRLKNIAADLFVADGYAPARSDSVYLKVSVEIKAGDETVKIFVPGPDAVVNLGGVKLNALGLLETAGTLSPRGQAATIAIAPGKSRTVTFLFESPITGRGGTLAVKGVGEAKLIVPAQPAPPATSSLAGVFNERAPRSLKPLLRDPVMAAIQAGLKQRMLIRADRKGKGFRIQIAPGKLLGSARPAGKGLYDTVIKYDGDELNCKLRLSDDGKLLILYLADKPFHQIVYTRKPPRNRRK